MLYQLKKNSRFIVIIITLFYSISNFAQQSEIQSTPAQVQLIFVNGIDDCPFYGIEGTFITELLTHFNGKKGNVNKEQHSLILEFNNWDNSIAIDKALVEYAEKNHYPASHLFELKNIIE